MGTNDTLTYVGLDLSLSLSALRGMEEAGGESLLQRLAKNSSPAASEDNAGKKHSSNLLSEDMDNKENLCTVSENGSDFSAASRAMPSTRRARRGGACNLRKSLAWNKAFSTEEGVLDPLELSILGGSATKSRVSFLSGICGEVSPLTTYNIRNRVNLDDTMHQGSVFDDKKDGDLFSTLEPSGHKDSLPHVIPEKAALSKGICRSIPRAPAVYSQKRQANANTLNPASKLPKFTATKSQTSSLTPTARCNVPAKRHSIQNAKPANVEQSARSKGSSLTLKRALNYPISSSRSSEHAYEKKTVNETSELPSSADTQTSEMVKCIADFKTPQSRLPTNRLSASVSSSNFDKVAHSFSQNAQHTQGGNPSAQGQAKPSGLRMPTPSLGFFCQAKNPLRGLQSQMESQKSGIYDHSGQSLKKSNNLKSTNNLETLHASQGQGQPRRSESTATKVSAASTPFSSKNTDFSGDLDVPSVTSSTLSPDISREASKRKISRSAIKTQVDSGQENDQEELHSYCITDESNMGKQFGRQGSGCGPESPSSLLLSMDNSSLLAERRFVNALSQTNQFENSAGMHLASEDSGQLQLVKSNAILEKCSPKRSQEGDGGMGELAMGQQCEGTRETSISASNEHLPDGKHDFSSGLNKEKDVEGCPLLEIKTSFKPSKVQIAGSTSLQVLCLSTGNVISSVEGENTESVVQGIGQQGLIIDTILLEEVHDTEKGDVSVPSRKSQIASQDQSEVMLNKQEPVEKPKQVSVLLNQLKAEPFSDEWVAALESFGEDILQIKTGAVQNSPPDKPTPEVGPWSPVRRKNQDIGPYDCTKYAKSLSTASSQ